jgi:hypothetical protein
LQKDAVVDHQYCPQMGDRVIYFPQGHREILSQFVENTIPPWQDKELFVQRWPLVECEVTGIQFEFPTEQEHKFCNSVVVVVRLGVCCLSFVSPSYLLLHISFPYLKNFHSLLMHYLMHYTYSDNEDT